MVGRTLSTLGTPPVHSNCFNDLEYKTKFTNNAMKCYVKWNNKKSSVFSIQNGVRQGAIMSPCLFCLYLDTLLERLRNSGIGYQIGGIYFGALAYADEIILMSPSRRGLQLMLDICQ